jgi:2-keto-4-pentenoate hydratase/2-oxohepta-3-ene-1,7-dioic acid hydratase in catechol pathway
VDADCHKRQSAGAKKTQGETMKLLSVKLAGGDHAGILREDEILLVTKFCATYAAPLQASALYKGERVWRDAMDIYQVGVDWAKSLCKFLETREVVEECRSAGLLLPLAKAELNPPVLTPGKILAVGWNYAAHAAEQNLTPPDKPLIFTKCVTSLNKPGGVIQLPRISRMVDYEGELALVIGKEGKNITAATAYEYIAGYMIMNDVSARDLQRNEKQWTRAKGLDTFAPCGPWLVTTDEIPDPHILDISLRVNGELRQSSNTKNMFFKIPELLEFVSQDLTLRAGDIITTGTPEGVGVYRQPPVFLQAGDQIDIDIAGVGRLTNTVGE